VGQKSTPGSVDRSGPAREGRSPNGSSARRQSRRYRVSGARTARQQQRCAGPHCGSLARKKRLPRLTVAAFTNLILTDQHYPPGGIFFATIRFRLCDLTSPGLYPSHPGRKRPGSDAASARQAHPGCSGSGVAAAGRYEHWHPADDGCAAG